MTFDIGEYDKTLPLVIDPGMVFSTFISGQSGESFEGVVTDDTGAIYITGYTVDTSFPTTPGAYQTTKDYGTDTFVVKLNASGKSLDYSTFIGGNHSDKARAIAVDDKGCAYITGETGSTDFPITLGAFDSTITGGEGFVLKLSTDGSKLEFSTFVGGSSSDEPRAISVDSSGQAYLTGNTNSADYPTTVGAYVTNSSYGVILTKVAKDGTSLVYSTYIGVNQTGTGWDVEVDDQGRAYLVIATSSSTFPTTAGAFDTSHNGDVDMVLLKMNAAGSAPVYSTYVGGSAKEYGFDLVVDNIGNAYVAGYTTSNNLPVVVGSYDLSLTGTNDGFVLKLNAAGSSLSFLTYLGGRDGETASGLVLDSDGNIVVTGGTNSWDYPATANAYDMGYDNNGDCFVTKLDAKGKKVIYSTFVGDWNPDTGRGIVIDGDDLVTVVGITTSQNFPTTPGSYDPTYNGNGDMFVFRLDMDAPEIAGESLAAFATTGDPYELNFTVSDNMAVANVTVEYWFGNSTTHDNVTMARTGGDERQGTWTVTVDIPLHSLEPLRYLLVMNDTVSNSNTTLERNVTVLDNDHPILEDESPLEGTTGDPFDFKVNATDNIDVGGVYVVYWFGNRTSQAVNISMDRWSTSPNGNGTWYNDSLTLPLNSLDPLRYYFDVVDGSGNWNRSGNLSVEVSDNDPPDLLADRSDGDATTGDTFHFEVEVVDNIGIERVELIYWFEATSLPVSHVNMTGSGLGPLGNGTYIHDILLADNYTQRMMYRFLIVDPSGRSHLSIITAVNIRDNDPPEVLSDGSDAAVTTGDVFHLKVVVEDNIGIYTVHAMVWLTDEPSRQMNITLFGIETHERGNGTYESEDFTLPEHSVHDVSYYLLVRDTSGIWNRTSTRVVPGSDNDPPETVVDASDGNATTGDPFVFNVTVIDNVGISGVWVYYWVGGYGYVPLNVTMTPVDVDEGANGTYGHTISIPEDTSGKLRYGFFILDVHGNWITVPEVVIDVLDDDLPVIVEDLSRVVDGPYVTFLFEARVSDNIGIQEVMLEYSLDGGETVYQSLGADDVTGLGNGTYSWALEITSEETITLEYLIWARDLSGNLVETDRVWLIVQDLEPPVFRRDASQSKAVKGKMFTFAIAVVDDLGVGSVFVEFWIGDGPRTNLSMDLVGEYTRSIILDREANGTLGYRFSASDMAGNWAATDVRTVPLINPPPVISAIPPVNVTEGIPTPIDLAEYVSDDNDEDAMLVVHCEDPRVTVDGLNLTLLFDDWIPDHRIEFTVSDGEEIALSAIDVHVVNVNDPPWVLITSPTNDSRIDFGKPVSFHADFGDPDLGEGQELEIVWRSDIDGELARFDDIYMANFELSTLRPGEHEITVSISDGEFTRESKVIVVVLEDGGKVIMPSSYYILLIILIVVAVLIVYHFKYGGQPS